MHRPFFSTGYTVSSASQPGGQRQGGLRAQGAEAQAQQVVPPPPVCPGGTLYTVRSGDTMWLIAQRFGVSLDALIAANPQVKDPSLVFPGQVLCVPGPPAPPACPGGFLYTVQPGDTLFAIAQKFGVSLQDLIASNPQIKDPSLIFPGQVICIPAVKRPFCPATLDPTPNAPEAIGAVFVVPATGHAFFVGHNLPPLELGTTYVGWVRDSKTGAVVRVELTQTLIGGTWIGLRKDGTPFVGYDEAFITREPLTLTPPEAPTGPRIVQGSIAHCR